MGGQLGRPPTVSCASETYSAADKAIELDGGIREADGSSRVEDRWRSIDGRVAEVVVVGRWAG